MANITGTTRRERINAQGTYYWDGNQWVLVAAAGTTTGADTVRAGAGDDIIDGGQGNDFLYGEAGNDEILGGAGYDRLEGGAGNDRLNGGASLDDLFGGAGSDVFVFGPASESAATNGAFDNAKGDFIGDFTSTADTTVTTERDKIDLTGLVAAAAREISWNGASASANAAWAAVTGTRSYLYIDVNGDAVADFALMFSTIETLSAADIVGLKSGNVTPPDTTPPASPSIDLDAASDDGASNTDNKTTVTTPLLIGAAEAGSTVRIFDGATLLGQTVATANSTWSFRTAALNPGPHILTATATDAAGNTSPASLQLSVLIETTPTPPQTFMRDVRVASSADDGEQQAITGEMYLTSSDLELGSDPADWGAQSVGLRFDNLNIPLGATITRAWIQFTADEAQADVTNLAIRAQLSADAASFTNATNNVSGRPLTSVSVQWAPPAWNTIGEAGVNQRTPDLTNLVQRVVGQTAWSPDNAIAFSISGTGHRTAESFESGAALAPQLHVEFTMATTPPKPATRFAVIGDYGTDDATELRLANLVKSLTPDFIVTTGDNVHRAGVTLDQAVGKYFSDYIGNYQGVFGAGSATNKFFPTLSDNDYSIAGLPNYLNYFTLPTASSGNERYYSFKFGTMEFFMLNTEVNEPDGRLATSAQASWLKNSLAASTADLKIVVSPAPPYSSGDYGVYGVGSTPEVQWPYEQWGADVVLSGEDHLYERILRDANGDGVKLPFFVNGFGTVEPLPFLATPVAGSEARYNADNGVMLVSVTDDVATFEFHSLAGGDTVVDSYTMAV